jgi:hypothetical protein
MLRLEHPNVVGCLQPLAGLDPGTPDLPSLCMEYCEGHCLTSYINTLSCRSGKIYADAIERKHLKY